MLKKLKITADCFLKAQLTILSKTYLVYKVYVKTI